MADRTVTAKLALNILGYVNSAKVVVKSNQDMAQSAVAYGQKHGAQLDALSMKAGILGAGLTALAGFAVKSAMDWETAWAGVTKTVSGTPQQLAAIEQGLRDMATQIPATAEELAAIAESAGALGVETGSILSFTRVMADLGQTTNLTSEEAATSIAQLMNVMQTAPDDVDNLGSALVDLGNKGASTEREIIQMAQNIAGAGAIIGLSEANVLGLANALASSGINAEAGGSAISNVMIDIAKAVDTNSAKLAGFADVAGLSADEFAAKWKSTPAEALTEFVEGLGRMNDAGENVFGTLEDLGQSDVRVTRALLNMAASGDMLRESLANGDSAWEKNSALAIEAAKRYETTAAQTQMAWNEIKSAAIDAGAALLPVVASIAGGVGEIASAFGSLPGPVKGALTTITGIGGVSLLATAGVLKLLSSVSQTKATLDALSESSPRLAGNLGKIGKAAGIAGTAFVALRVAGDLFDTDDSASVVKYTQAILKLGDSSNELNGLLSNKKGISSQIEGLSDLSAAIKEADPGTLNKKFGALFGTIGFNPYGDAIDDVKAYDQALVSLVTGGAIDQAAEGAQYFAEQAKAVGKDSDDVAKLLPGYNDALTQVSNSQTIAGESATGMATKVAEIPPAMQEARDAAQKTGEAFFDIGNGVDDAKLSLDDWIAQMADQAKALEQFADNAATAGKRGLEDGLIADLEELGPAGAMRMAQLANATDAEIGRANKSWLRGQKAIDDYVDATGGVPPIVGTTVKVSGVAAAIATVNALKRLINGLPGVHIPVASYGDEHRGQLKAAGGPIFGPGSGTSDDVPLMGSNGEHMWTAAEVRAAGGHQAVSEMRAAVLAGATRTREFAGAPSYASSSSSNKMTFSDSDINRLAAAVARQPVMVEAHVKMTDRDWATGVQRGTDAEDRLT